MSDPPLGAYGVAWPSLPSVRHLLQPIDPMSPAICALRFLPWAPETAEGFHFDARQSVLRLGEAGSVAMDREEGTVTFALDETITEQGLVHPYLGFPTAVFNRWAGRDSFHAGAIVIDDRAIIVAGHKEAGKSTTLAALSEHGVAILSDDLVALDGLDILPGPRCVDLRPAAAAHLGIGAPLGVLGARERWRITTGAVMARPLGGIVYLEWGGEVTLTLLPIADRLRRLFEFDALEVGPVDPASFIDLAAVPSWELRRPRTTDSITDSLDVLLSRLGS